MPSFRRPRSCGLKRVSLLLMIFVMALQCLRRCFQVVCTLRNLFLLNCTVLLLNVLFYAINSGLILSSVEVHFLSPIDPDYSDLLDRTFRAFTEAMDSDNVTYLIFSGSLIGSWRNHGRIPWDDDIDVLINASDREAVRRVLRSKMDEDPAGSFGLFDWAPSGQGYAYQWKFYPRNGQVLLHKKYRTPYVDIFFYLENETHIWNASPYFLATEIWPKSHVFPLRRRPFGNLMVPAPCNPEAFLEGHFNVSLCESRAFSHLFDIHLPLAPVSVPCQRLASLYPFVQRTALSTGLSQESLVLHGKTLHKFITPVSC